MLRPIAPSSSGSLSLRKAYRLGLRLEQLLRLFSKLWVHPASPYGLSGAMAFLFGSWLLLSPLLSWISPSCLLGGRVRSSWPLSLLLRLARPGQRGGGLLSPCPGTSAARPTPSGLAPTGLQSRVEALEQRLGGLEVKQDTLADKVDTQFAQVSAQLTRILGAVSKPARAGAAEDALAPSAKAARMGA